MTDYFDKTACHLHTYEVMTHMYKCVIVCMYVRISKASPAVRESLVSLSMQCCSVYLTMVLSGLSDLRKQQPYVFLLSIILLQCVCVRACVCACVRACSPMN
jgi:hypothetical protein